jgi:hypothetical protein
MMSAWFVALNGTNTNPGTLAQPFATIQEAANVAQPGDTVYIRGGSYHETVDPVNSGTASAPITFEPYNNESVTIDGADAVTGWTSYQGNIYQAPQGWDLGEGNNQVFVDGKMVNEARYPNSSANVSTPTWTTASTVNVHLSNSGLSTVTIYNSGLNQPAGAWVGAVAHIATGAEWVDQTGTITASSPGSITVSYYQETSYQVPRAGNRFYIVGAPVALNSAGEWYRNPGNGQLYLWDPSSDSPANHTIEAKARQYGFDLSGASYISIQGIKLFACTVNTNSGSNHDVVNQITATYVSQAIGTGADQEDPWGAQYHPHTTGIILNGQYNVLENSTIAYSSGDGVFLGGSSNTVQNCTIHDVNYEAGDEAGVTTLGNNENVLYNTIYNTGRSGIVSRYTTHSHIMFNVIHDVGLQMTDLGAIYTWGTDGQGTEIGHNVCYNVHTGGYGAAGVYLDNTSQNFIVDHNATYNIDFGLKLGPPSYNNEIVNNTFAATQYGLDTVGTEDMSGTSLVNNIFTKHAILGPGLYAANNLYYQTNPQFVNPSAANFQLNWNSPAINAGRAVSPYNNGYLGSAPDIGAYEYGEAPFFAGAAPMSISSSSTQTQTATPPPVVTSSETQPPSFSAASYVHQWGVVKNGMGISFIDQWGYALYGSVNFDSGISQFILTASHLPAAAEKIELRIDGPSGPTLSTITLPASTSPSSAKTTFKASLPPGLHGVHNVYLVLGGAPVGGEIDGFTFA